MSGLGQALVDEASEKERDKVLAFLLKNGKITQEDANETIKALQADSSTSTDED